LAIPPMAGLHDICPIRSKLIATRAVFAPRRAAADALHQPACPPPITMTSNVSSKTIVTYQYKRSRRFARARSSEVVSPVIAPRERSPLCIPIRISSSFAALGNQMEDDSNSFRVRQRRFIDVTRICNKQARVARIKRIERLNNRTS